MQVTMKTTLATGQQVSAMLAALKKAKVFTVKERTHETVIVTHSRVEGDGEVLRGLRNGRVWIVRHAVNLFE